MKIYVTNVDCLNISLNLFCLFYGRSLWNDESCIIDLSHYIYNLDLRIWDF